MKLIAQYRLYAQECRKLAADSDKKPDFKEALEMMSRAWENAASEREAYLLREIELESGLANGPKSTADLCKMQREFEWPE
jgi:hypothetical protein